MPMTKQYIALLDDGREIAVNARSYEAALCLAAAAYPASLCAVLEGDTGTQEQARRWFFGDERETNFF